MKPVVDIWANFLMNEKLVPERMRPEWIVKIVELCAAMAAVRRPNISMHKFKLESREFVCLTAMEMGIDLPAIKHKTTGKVLMGRGLLDAWNLAYKKKFGDNYGTLGVSETIRRNLVTKLSKDKSNV